MNPQKQNILLIVVGFLLVGALACCATIGLLVARYAIETENSTPAALPTTVATQEPATLFATPIGTSMLRPTAIPSPITQGTSPTATPRKSIAPTENGISQLGLNIPAFIEQRPLSPFAHENLRLIWEINYPIHDEFVSYQQFSDSPLSSRTVASPDYQIGDKQTFITDYEVTVTAVLLAITEHAYFWVDEDLSPDPQDVQAVADRFETEYYPFITTLYGAFWQPGMDNNPHFSILHLANPPDTSELGFFYGGDEYPLAIDPISNQQEILYLNMQELLLGEDLYFGTLVHEFEHLIQWHNDQNESSWLDEGLAQLAELYVGLDTVDTHYDYTYYPNVQLNSWESDDDDQLYAHYGASFLFVTYLWEQYGDQFITDLAHHPANSMESVRAVLQKYDPARSVEQLLADWFATNYIDGLSIDPIYQYSNLELDFPAVEEKLNSNTPYTGKLYQYNPHYLELDFSKEKTLSFAGDTLIELLSGPPHSGDKMWYAPGSDQTEATLTASFDLSLAKTAELNFWSWYDLEEEWDFAYVTVSLDDGENWDVLFPNHVSSGDYGPAFSGRSLDEEDAENGWVPEVIPLNTYIGHKILVRFVVFTDSAITGRGFAIDDLSIQGIGYQDDFEGFAQIWEGNGFIHSGWQLPQQWSIQLIQLDGTDNPPVTELILDSLNQGQWTIEATTNNKVLIVTPLTPFVKEQANYWLNLTD